MYTNNETDIGNEVKKHLDKGDIDFELHFAERSFDRILLDEILGSFCGVLLPDNLSLKLNFSTSNVADDLITHLANKLSEIKWPRKFTLTLLLRNNMIDDKSASFLLDLLKKFNSFPEAEVFIDLDNNNSISSSFIGEALKNINNSTIEDSAIVSPDKNKAIRFCDYLIQEYLSEEHENDDDD